MLSNFGNRERGSLETYRNKNVAIHIIISNFILQNMDSGVCDLISVTPARDNVCRDFPLIRVDASFFLEVHCMSSGRSWRKQQDCHQPTMGNL